MKVLDLFCGAGGFSLGFQQAGFEIIMGLDNDPGAAHVYLDNIGAPVLVQDIRDWRPNGHRRPDVVIGSPPCQCFSQANTKSKTCDLSLVDEFFRVVGELRPRVWIMEEVNGVLTALKRRGPRGFHVTRIDAADYGIPSHRHRFFASNVSPILPLMKVHHVPASTVLGEGAVETHIYPQRKGRSVFPTTEPAPTITGKGMNLIGLHVNRQFDPDSRCDFPLGEPSPTVTTKDPRGLLSAGRHRMLTVQETAALMTFPPDYRWPEAIRAARRMVGNAVPPFLARQIAETVKIHLDFKNGGIETRNPGTKTQR